jgi:uncharacterized membrane protein YeaQ/YmgE (transglycosylase-associated protein family)
MGGILAIILVLIVAYILIGLALNVTMGIGGLIITLVVWAIIGWLAGQLMRGGGYGALGNIALGIGGGIVGSLLFNLIGQPNADNGLLGSVVVGVIGAVILIVIGRLIRRET